jgi:Flp pilus assembly protein CpaB
LLGVLLALAAGAIVIFVVSTSGGNPLAASVTVVVANQDLPAGDVLSTSKNGVDPVTNVTYIPISAAFVTKTVNADFAPKNAYIFQSQDSLNNLLNNEVLTSTFYAGEILRQNDPRLAAPGVGAAGSLTTNNPGKLKVGYVLAQITITQKPAVVPGDSVNVIATFCNIPNKPGKCETQTTLSNVYVYAISGNNVFVVVNNQDAVNLQYLLTTASNVELVIRDPGDTTIPTTTPADNSSTSSHFNY